MRLSVFNQIPADQAVEVLRPCIDVSRWVNEIVAARPFATTDEFYDFAVRSAAPFSHAEVTAALAHHPRIGERAAGNSAEAKLSRGEQATLTLDADVTTRLAQANAEYEARFDRVFLIRAAGRTSEEILAECQRRLHNDEATELLEVADQLRQIALLRLRGAVTD